MAGAHLQSGLPVGGSCTLSQVAPHPAPATLGHVAKEGGRAGHVTRSECRFCRRDARPRGVPLRLCECVASLSERDLQLNEVERRREGDEGGRSDQGRRERSVAPHEEAQEIERAGSARAHRLSREQGLEVGGELECSGIALLGSLGEGLQRDALEVLRHFPVDLAQRRWRDVQDLVDHGLFRLSSECRAPGRQLVENETQSVHVAPLVEVSFQSLGRHVPESSDDIALLGKALVTLDLAQPEVRETRGSSPIQEDVGWLDVSMEDALGVGIREGLGEPMCDPG